MRNGVNDVEEDWLRRRQKREAAVYAIKKTPAYILVRCRGNVRAETPNPHDRRMSKRKWESSIMRWREGLRRELLLIHLTGATPD